MSEVFCKMEDSRSLEKNAGFNIMNIPLIKAIFLQDGGDYGALKNMENNLKKMGVKGVYYCRNGIL